MWKEQSLDLEGISSDMFYSSDEIRFCLIQETRLGFVWLVSWTCLLAVHGWLYLTHSGLRRPFLKNWFQAGSYLPAQHISSTTHIYWLTHHGPILSWFFWKKWHKSKRFFCSINQPQLLARQAGLNQPAVNLKDFKCFIFSFGPFVKYISHVNWFWLRARHLMVGRRLHFFMQLFAFLQS